ncbi:alpha/beta hydrolase [Kitasatospora sp. NBC_01266]|uniref:alpha/beta hydrolase n=1 Tax=Kitasatospora sp. NBC_01266 TaxID=2903572 RepID=UPI002E34A656|nr:alpha/beta hydrolase [Kitasatospora sp. NBC_01266]
MDLAALRDADPQLLPEDAEAYEQLADALQQHIDAWQSGVRDRTSGSGWLGTAADACRASLQQTDDRLIAARTELRRIGACLRAGADALRLAQAELASALADARAAGVTLGPDGSIPLDPATPAAERHDPDARARRTALTGRVRAVLAGADALDRALAEQLAGFTRAATDGSGLTDHGYAPDPYTPAPLSPLITAPDLLRCAVPPPSASPEAVAAWWRALPPDQQQHLITTRPDLIGNRDGLPATARDQANRLLLRRYLDDFAARTWRSVTDQLKLDGLRAIQERLDRSPANPPVLLYGISCEGQGRGILSFGNPDTASNVSAYVPGLGTELRCVGGKDADRALSVWRAALRADPTRPTASMVWLGYDPPPGIDKHDPQTLDVMGEERARAGAESYDRFMAGLRAAHEGPPAHLVALGHSYGSLTVGLAGRRPGGGTRADDIVLIGSPGAGADNAGQLGVAADHVWVGAADNDPVTYLPDPLQEVLGDQNGRWFGKDPASADFGAHRFDVADGPPHSFSAHSNYLDPIGGHALPNIGQIVTGHPENVRSQVPR